MDLWTSEDPSSCSLLWLSLTWSFLCSIFVDIWSHSWHITSVECFSVFCLSRVSLGINAISHWVHLKVIYVCLAGLLTVCCSVSFSTTFFYRKALFLRAFLFRVLSLCFFHSKTFVGITIPGFCPQKSLIL